MNNKVLIIDDEMPILIVLRALFRSSGFDVTISNGGDEAAKLVTAGGYNLIITDVRMNPINGVEFLKMSQEKHPETIVIMISAYDSPEAYAQIKRLGAYEFVRKPFENEALLRLVKQALSGHSQSDKGAPPSQPKTQTSAGKQQQAQ